MVAPKVRGALRSEDSRDSQESVQDEEGLLLGRHDMRRDGGAFYVCIAWLARLVVAGLAVLGGGWLFSELQKYKAIVATLQNRIHLLERERDASSASTALHSPPPPPRHWKYAATSLTPPSDPPPPPTPIARSTSPGIKERRRRRKLPPPPPSPPPSPSQSRAYARTKAREIAAIIIDPHWDNQMVDILSSYLNALPHSVPIFWFTHRPCQSGVWAPGALAESARERLALNAIRAGRLRQHVFTPNFLAPHNHTMTQSAYNLLRNDPTFLQYLMAHSASSRILFFEKDTVACATYVNNQQRATKSDLLQQLTHRFDYIGAPWAPQISKEWCEKEGVDEAHCCCNSGLSVLNVPAFLEVIGNYPPVGASQAGQNDMYFVRNTAFKQALASNSTDFRLAQAADGLAFSVETVWREGQLPPWGVHKPWFRVVLSYRNLGRLARVCPELRLLCPYAVKKELRAQNYGAAYYELKSAERFQRVVCDATPRD